MVDPYNITNYNLSDWELEEHALFWIAVAGKTANVVSKCLDKMFTEHAVFYQNNTPLNWVLHAHALYDLPQTLKHYGIGCYTLKAKAFFELAKAVHNGELDLRTCTADELDDIYGIGPKTARCFILHSREGARYVGLDTHLLKYMRDEMSVENVPKSTPSSKKEYKRLEDLFLKHADELGKTPAELDLEVWRSYAR